MFTTNEVKETINDLNQFIGKNWEIFEEQGSVAFTNSEFINIILSWREEGHPKKLLGGFKTYEDFFFGVDILEQKKSLKQIAKEINYPDTYNSGEGWRRIDFEKELILYLHIQKSAGQSGLILTNENLYLFMCKNKISPESVIKIIPISDLHGKSINIGKSITGIHSVELNNEKIGYMTIENSGGIHPMRDLLNAACNRAPKLEKPKETASSTSEESALDKIKKLKELFDSGAISEEEFQEKKNSLMDTL